MIRLEQSWKTRLAPEFEKPYFQELSTFVKNEYAKNATYPHPKNIFKALDLCPFEDVSVVILGQDPYHGARQANGLCFAVPEEVPIPPSLSNIFKEIENDLGIPADRNPDLSRWARQGVLLLNATLTVRAGTPGSHQGKGWEKFTDAIVRLLSEEREHLVFMLWGNYARQKGSVIDRNKHCVLEAAHPSPFSASGFFGCKHFSKANAYLVTHGKSPIKW